MGGPDSPETSVILTTYYRNDGLRRALEGILAQDYPYLEVIVVDDSGERHAESVAREYDPVEYVPHATNRGQIAGWNTGMDRASGSYVQFHDDDDWLFEDKVRKQVRFLEANPDIGTVYCGIVDQDGVERLPLEGNRGNVVEPVLRHRMLRCQTTTMLTRRAVLDRVFPLARYPAATDILLQLELCQRTKFDFLDEALVYRSLDGGIGDSVRNRETRIRLVHDYGSLYEDYPDLKRETLARSYRMLGRTLLEDRLWSPRAIGAFARAVSRAPGVDAGHVAWFVASLFGRPGVRAYETARPSLKRAVDVVR